MAVIPENSIRLVVIAPTYNNARTLGEVIEQLAWGLGLAVIVVNDGCDDDSAAILARWSSCESSTGRWVVTHDRNLGKAAALRSGFGRARQLGFTHAITIDTDGQHDVADVPSLIRLAQQRPDALVLGARSTNVGNYPLGSRIGRW